MFEFFLVLIFLLGIFVGLPGYFVFRGYTELSRCAGNIRRAASGILRVEEEVEILHHRFDEKAKEYMDHEKATLIGMNARESTFDGSSSPYYQTILTSVPEIKADMQVRELFSKEERLIKQLGDRKEIFAHCIEDYNDARRKIPTFLFADRIGFQEAEVVEIKSFDDLRDLKDFSRGSNEQFKQMLTDVGSSVAQKGKQIKSNVENRRQLSREAQGQIEGNDQVEIEATWEEVEDNNKKLSSEQLEDTLESQAPEKIQQSADELEEGQEQQVFAESSENTEQETENEMSNKETPVEPEENEESNSVEAAAPQRPAKKDGASEST